MPEIKFHSDWLKIGDNVLQGDTIQFLDVGEVDENDRHNFTVAVFRNGELVEPTKKFTLNKGNFKAISALYGTNSDAWVGKEMNVVSVKVRNPQLGTLVDSIALVPPLPPVVPTTPAPTTPETPVQPTA